VPVDVKNELVVSTSGQRQCGSWFWPRYGVVPSLFEEAARPIQRNKSTLDEPSSWQNLEPLLVGAFDHLDRVREDLSGPVNHRAPTAYVHEHYMDSADESK
jgi:hypothetical protein